MADPPSPLSNLPLDIIVIIDYIVIMVQQDSGMSTLLIRNVDPTLKDALRIRAAQNGRSMEAELRQIVSDALAAGQSSAPNLAEAIRRRMAPFGGVDLEPHPPVPMRNPPELG